MKTLFSLSAICFLLLTGSSFGQNSAHTRSSLAGLGGVMIRVEPTAEELADKGMTDFVFAVEIERRLKEAGIAVINPEASEPEPGRPTLYLEVTALIDDYVDQVSYAIRLELTQAVRLDRDLDSKEFHVATWSVGGMGVYAKGWRQAMIDDVLGYTDEFIDAYFKANPSGGD